MNGLMGAFKSVTRAGVGAPVLLVAILAMMVVPLPAWALDLLFSFNITLSLVIVLAVVYVMRPLDFSVFPTVLLVVTLLRLALNVASTRVVLLEGHTGADAAGHVIQAFGEFVVGGNYAVGLVVFAILVIINFVVVTKGAGRISEVTARFTLDAMPGKQMGVDADLNAGVITQEEAQRRREEIREEADFFGSMDGASKFVRGDAVAGILILLINILGGLSVGTLQHDLPIADAARVYTLLTIGDGLVGQIPSLLMSTGAAMIVTRVSRSQDMGEQVFLQLFEQPRALAISGAVLLLLGVIPGMPNVVFLTLAAVALGASYYLDRRGERPEPEPVVDDAPEPEVQEELSWDEIGPVDALGIEIGYRLIPLVDAKQGGELMSRIRGVRKKLTRDLGFLIQPVHIRDNLELGPEKYRISVLGVPVAEGEVHPGRDLAINPGRVSGLLTGVETRDPAFGLQALWIEPGQRDHAQTLGYTVVDASTVIATHLSHIIQQHAPDLLGHEEVQQLLERLAGAAPKVVEDLVPKTVPMALVVRVLQDLLKERVPITNLRTIAETLAEHGSADADPANLLTQVRLALSQAIVQKINGLEPELPAFTLDPKLEQILLEAYQQSVQQGSDGFGIEPNLAERVHQALAEQTQRQEAAGEPAVLLVAPRLRAWLARFTRQGIPGLNVLAYNEVPDNRKVRLVAAVGN